MYKSPRYTSSSRLSGWGYCVGLFIFAVAATGLILGAVSLSKIHDLEPASAASVQELTSAQLAAVQGEIDALRASQSNADGTLDKQLKTLERSMRDEQGTSKKIDEAMLGLQASQRRLGFVEEAYNRLTKAVQTMGNDDSAMMMAGKSTSSSSSDDDDDDSSSSGDAKRNPLVYCETDAQCGPAPVCRTVQCVSEFWSKLGLGEGPHCSLGLAPTGTQCVFAENAFGACDSAGDCVPSAKCEAAQKFLGTWTAESKVDFIGFINVSLAFCDKSDAFFDIEEGVFGTEKNLISRDFAFVQTGRLVPGLEDVFITSSLVDLHFQRQGKYAGQLISFGGTVFTSFYKSALNGLVTFSKASISPDEVRPSLLSTDSDVLFQDTSDRVLMFDFIADIFLEQSLGSLNEAFTNQYIGNSKARALQETLKREGIQRSSFSPVNVLKSRKGSAITVLVLDSYTGHTPYDKYIVSGFQGEWEVLNDVSVLAVSAHGTNPSESFTVVPDATNHAALPQFTDPEKYEFRIFLALDTAAFPVYNATLHGSATFTPERHGPVRHDIGYRNFLSCVYEFIHGLTSEQGTTHHGMFAIAHTLTEIERGTVPETWEQARQLQSEQLAQGLTYGRTGFRIAESVTSNTLYTGALAGAAVINEPFEALGNVNSISYGSGGIPGGRYAVPRNYIDPDSVHYVWHRAKPNSPVTTPDHELVGILGKLTDIGLYARFIGGPSNYNAYAAVTEASGLLDEGATEGASEFEGFVSKTFWGTATINPVTNQPDIQDCGPNGTDFCFASPVVESASLLPDFVNDFYVAFLRPEFVGGRKIAYMNFHNTLTNGAVPFVALDDQFGVGLSEDGPVAGEGYVPIICNAVVRFFNEYQLAGSNGPLETLIIDNRFNIGGNAGILSSFQNCLGDKRVAFSANIVFKDSNYDSASTIEDTYETVYKGELTTNSANLTKFQYRPDLVEQKYGANAVLKDVTIVQMTTVSAFSAGEVLQHIFQGKNGDGNFANGVKAVTVGSTARIVGAVGNRLPVPISNFAPEFKNSDGKGVSPLLVNTDPFGTFENSNLGRQGSFATRVLADGSPKIAVWPVHSNLTRSPLYAQRRDAYSLAPQSSVAHGPLSMAYKDTAYHDFGYYGPGEDSVGNKFSDGHWDPTGTGITQIDRGDGVLFPGLVYNNTAFTAGQTPPIESFLSLRDSYLEEAIRVACLINHGVYCEQVPFPSGASRVQSAGQQSKAKTWNKHKNIVSQQLKSTVPKETVALIKKEIEEKMMNDPFGMQNEQIVSAMKELSGVSK